MDFPRTDGLANSIKIYKRHKHDYMLKYSFEVRPTTLFDRWTHGQIVDRLIMLLANFNPPPQGS